MLLDNLQFYFFDIPILLMYCIKHLLLFFLNRTCLKEAAMKLAQKDKKNQQFLIPVNKS